MATVQILSADEPFDRPDLGRAAIEVLGLAEAMGLLPADAEFRALDWKTVRSTAEHIAKAGIATAVVPNLDRSSDPDRTLELLRTLAAILEENPAPDFEWERLQKVFPNDELAKLLGISVTSVGRYSSHARKTPDAVAARLHFLARTIRYLEGAYSSLGVRRWFHRPRKALRRKAPAAILKDEWDPDHEGPRDVLALARSLNGSGAT